MNFNHLTKPIVKSQTMVKGISSTKIIKEMRRSCVGETRIHIGRKELERTLRSEGIPVLKVKGCRICKFILEFRDVHTKLHVIKEKKEILYEHLDTIRDWSEAEASITQRVCVEMHGLPLHGWKEKNVRKIGKILGEVIWTDEEMENTIDFTPPRALIDMVSFRRIEEWVVLELDGNKFDIHVRELEVAAVAATAAEEDQSTDPRSPVGQVTISSVWIIIGPQTVSHTLRPKMFASTKINIKANRPSRIIASLSLKRLYGI